MSDTVVQSAAQPAEELLLLGTPDPKQFTPKPPRTLLFGVVAVLVVLAAAASLVALGIQAKETQFRSDLERRLGILATGRSELVTAWLDGTLRLGDRVARSDFFRLFAQDVDVSRGGGDPAAARPKPSADPNAPDQPTVAEQLPLMTNVLTEFVANASLFTAYLLDRRGQVVLTTDSAAPVGPAQKEIATAALEGRAAAFGPLRVSARGLVLDVAMPVFPPRLDDAARSTVKPVATLVLVVPAGDRVAGFLKSSPLAEPWERLRLIQKNAAGFEEIAPGAAPPLRPAAFAPAAAAGGNHYALAERPAFDGAGRVYAVSAKVPALDWWVVQEAEAEQAYAEVASHNRTLLSIVGLVVLALIVGLGALWWYLVSGHNKRLALQFRDLAAKFNTQKRFLDSINNTIIDLISLKDLGGAYRYVNPAFARAVGRPLDKVTGLDDAALFGQGTADRLRLSDDRALAEGRPVTADEKLFLSGRLHYMQLTKIPFLGADEDVQGIVSVARDVTEIVEEQKKREKAVKQMVVALVKAIELRDPYLAGHSQLVAGFAAAIARQLHATPQQVATVEIAANLCQIGKLSISRSLLNKPGRLTAEETQIIQSHVEHTATVLRDIDFELPVFDAIYQMNERLDGGGYPRGLKGDAIMLEARILSVCDVFCARVSPRSYRPAITAQETVGILAGNNTRYDPRVIEALGAVAKSVEGEKLLKNIKGGVEG